LTFQKQNIFTETVVLKSRQADISRHCIYKNLKLENNTNDLGLKKMVRLHLDGSIFGTNHKNRL